MNSDRKSIVWVFVALSIILIGLMLVCAQQQASQSRGDDLSADDDQFRQELLEMLDLADDLEPTESTSTVAQQTVRDDVDDADEDEDEDDVLALLIPEIETEEPAAQSVSTPAPTETTQSMGLSEDMFIKVRNDVARLEKTLLERSTAVDSLRQIIENRDARIRELEQRMAQGRSYAQVTRNSSSPVVGSSVSGFMAEYQAARSKFEGYQYHDAIEGFQSLLSRYPDHLMADNCQYWIGESYFGLKDYQKAILELQKVFAYSQKDKHDDAQLMIGLSYIRLNQPEMAKKEFETFINSFGNSEYLGIAQRYNRNT